MKRGEDLAETSGAKVEVQVEEDVDLVTGAFAERRDVIHEIAEQTPSRDEARLIGPPESRHPSLEPSRALTKQVGLERGEPPLADFTTEFDETATVRDGVSVVRRPGDAPRRGVTPVHPDVVSHLATKEHMARNTETTSLDIEEGVLDRADGLADYAALTRPSRGLQSKHDVLVPVDRVADERRGKRSDDHADAR